MDRWGRRADAVVAVTGAVVAVTGAVVAVTGALLVSDFRPTGGNLSDSHERGIVLLVAASVHAAATAALRRRQQGRWCFAVATAAALVAALTWPLVQWDQLALWAVTVPADLSGFWAAAFGDDVRFVLMDQREVSQGEYAAAAAVHVVAPLVAVGALAAVFLRRGAAATPPQPVLAGRP